MSDGLPPPEPAGCATVVLDTNIVLDLWVFADTASVSLREAITARRLHWIGTASMREELQRVLGYPQIVSRLLARQLQADEVLACLDRHVQTVADAPRADVRCRDPDDQKFVDLALRHRALLLSKDALVLALRKRMRLRGADVMRSWPAP